MSNTRIIETDKLLIDTNNPRIEDVLENQSDAIKAVANDLPPENRTKTGVRIGPNRRQKLWQSGKYLQQNRSS